MKVFMYFEDFLEFNSEPTCVALGNFDGVHIGHQQLIKKCVSVAEERVLHPWFSRSLIIRLTKSLRKQ